MEIKDDEIYFKKDGEIYVRSDWFRENLIKSEISIMVLDELENRIVFLPRLLNRLFWIKNCLYLVIARNPKAKVVEESVGESTKTIIMNSLSQERDYTFSVKLLKENENSEVKDFLETIYSDSLRDLDIYKIVCLKKY
ncbi:MAG: hypothetical protein MJZ50_07550 [Treponema sp.]|nr:hypothetical protein [Treponema sp.]